MNSQNPERRIPGMEMEPASDSIEARIALEGLTSYINAGGRGTRLSTLFSPHERRGVSKALLPIGDPPISLIEHQINKLSHAGVSTIIAGVGDHDNVAEHIRSVYADRQGIYAVCYPDQLGTGGDLVRAVREHSELFADNIIITNVDTLLDIDEGDFLAFHRNKGAEFSIALTMNTGVPNQGAFYIDDNDKVIYCGEATRHSISEQEAGERCAYRGSSTGAVIANKQTLMNLDWQPEDGALPLDKSIVASMIEKGAMFAFNNGTRLFTDIGTVPSWNDAKNRQAMIAPYIHYRPES